MLTAVPSLLDAHEFVPWKQNSLPVLKNPQSVYKIVQTEPFVKPAMLWSV